MIFLLTNPTLLCLGCSGETFNIVFWGAMFDHTSLILTTHRLGDVV